MKINKDVKLGFKLGIGIMVAESLIKIILILLLAGLSAVGLAEGNRCPIPEVTDQTGKGINKHDKEVLEQATKRCPELYPNSPCVKKFIKTNDSYRVICGQANDRGGKL